MGSQQMTRLSQSIRVQTLHNLDAVIQKATTMIIEIAMSSIQERKVFRVALTGGRTAMRLYTMIMHSVENYDGWEFWFGDERNLPEEHPSRNSLMAKESLFCNQQLKQFYPIPYKKNTANAATLYQKQLEANNAVPFDLVLLSLGEDGHIASLFPNQPYNNQEKVIPVEDAPKDPPSRVSLTASTLSNCRNMIVMATGTEKRDALSRWFRGEKLPVTTLEPINGIDLFTDQPIND